MIKRTILIALLTSTSAIAADTKLYRTVSSWQIRYDHTTSTCFMAWVSAQFTVLRLQVRNEHQWTMHIGSGYWKSIQPGASYPISLKIDNLPSWRAIGLGQTFGTTTMIGWTIPAKFLGEFVLGQSIRVGYEGKEIAHLSLDGSFAATVATLECQKDHRVRDPFIVTDPFSAQTKGESF